MGFASFGAKPNPPKKKRKIAGAEVDGEGSGSNNTPLGMRARAGKGDELGRPEGREGEEVGVGLGEKELGIAGGEGGYGESNHDGKNMPLMGEGGYSIHRPACNIIPPLDEDQQNPASLVQNPEEVRLLEEARERGLRRLEQMGQDRRADGEWDWGALRRGVRDERGDMAFYDASFVEDPWRGLRGEAAIRFG